MAFFSAVYRLALALWVGGIAMFTFVVTPIVFRTQGRDEGGSIVGAIFPVYFRYGLLLGATAFLARIFSGEAFRGIRRWGGTLLILSAILLSGYQTYRLAPRMERLKGSVTSFEKTSPDEPVRKEFSRLHGYSMEINIAVLLAGATLLVADAGFKR